MSDDADPWFASSSKRGMEYANSNPLRTAGVRVGDSGELGNRARPSASVGFLAARRRATEWGDGAARKSIGLAIRI